MKEKRVLVYVFVRASYIQHQSVTLINELQCTLLRTVYQAL